MWLFWGLNSAITHNLDTVLVVKQNALFREALQLLTVLPKHAVALSSAQSMHSHSRTAEEPNSLLAAVSPTCIYKFTLQFSQNKFKSSHLLEQWSQTGLMRPCFIGCSRNCHQDRDKSLSFSHH